jgi:hypothetical protein
MIAATVIAAARGLASAAAGAALLIAGATVEPASAQGDACKTEYITASGRGKFRPFTKNKELEGRGSAFADAVATWEREVAATLGDRWKKWEEAKDKTFDCAPTGSGKVIGASFIGCTIKGRPCSDGTPPSGEAPVASDDRGKAPPPSGEAPVASADRGKATPPSEEAPVASADRAKGTPPSRGAPVASADRGSNRRDRDRDDDDNPSYRQGSNAWRYRQEMRRQEGLTEWRHRTEDQQVAREEARQRRLKEERDRSERIARERAEARERYLARERD